MSTPSLYSPFYASLRKKRTFRYFTTGFPTKWRQRNDCMISILMTCNLPDLCRVSDWLKQGMASQKHYPDLRSNTRSAVLTLRARLTIGVLKRLRLLLWLQSTQEEEIFRIHGNIPSLSRWKSSEVIHAVSIHPSMPYPSIHPSIHSFLLRYI